MAEFAPIFIFSMIGGTLADRWKPRRTMVWSDLLTAASVFAVLLALIYGSWHALFFAAFVSSVLSQFSQPSAMKLFKRHVPDKQLQGVMAAHQSLSSLFNAKYGRGLYRQSRGRDDSAVYGHDGCRNVARGRIKSDAVAANRLFDFRDFVYGRLARAHPAAG